MAIRSEIEVKRAADLNSQAINYEKLAGEILRSLRGTRTQRQCSELLGYSFNQVGKWESGATHIKWEDFIHVAEALQIPIAKHFNAFFWLSEGEFSASSAIKHLAVQLSLPPRKSPAARAVMKRWLSGSSSPDFAEVLKMIDSQPAVLIGWLALFVDCASVPGLRARYAIWQLEVESVLSDPRCVFINAALELQSYKDLPIHSDRFLVEHACCDADTVQKTLATMLAKNAATFDGKKYYPSHQFEFSLSPNAKLRGLTKYTTELAASRYPVVPATQSTEQQPRNASVGSVRVVPMSQAAAKKVSELIAHFHNAVGKIVKEDSDLKTNVQIMLMHSFPSNINLPSHRAGVNKPGKGHRDH